MANGVVPHSDIDTDGRWWGFSHTKDWIIGYKLHLITSTNGSIVVPLGGNFIQSPKHQTIRCNAVYKRQKCLATPLYSIESIL